MKALSILYDTQIDYEAVIDYSYFEGRRGNIQTYSLVQEASMLMVDHFKRDTYLHHNDPGCRALFGAHTSESRVSDSFLEGFVPPEHGALFAGYITAIKETMRGSFLEGNRNYYFTFVLPLAAPRRRPHRYLFTVFPYLYSADGRLWVTGYLISPARNDVPDDLKLHVVNEAGYRYYSESGGFRREECSWRLSENEKRILKMSAEGFTEQQIADQLNLGVGALKNKKIALFGKMDVNTIYAAISKAFKNGDI